MTDSSRQTQDPGHEDVLVVLGCRVVAGAPSGALTGRLERALAVHHEMPSLSVIMSGGKSWDGTSEARAMEHWWRSQNLNTKEVLLETTSTTTKENAAQVALLCREMGYRRIVLVTSDFHMRRAAYLFARRGLTVTSCPADTSYSWWRSAKLRIREGCAFLLDVVRPEQ